MINRLGVKPCLFLFALVFAPVALAGCASAPISMQAEEASSLSAAQVELRAQANALATRLDTAGWTVSATPAEATRSFLGRLIGGSETVSEDPANGLDLYVTETDFVQVQRDIETLVIETRALADQTLVVASIDGSIDSGSLERDLAAVERALGAVRRANRFFDAVADHSSWGEGEEAELDDSVERIEAVSARLGTAADALAERRWASRSGLFG